LCPWGEAHDPESTFLEMGKQTPLYNSACSDRCVNRSARYKRLVFDAPAKGRRTVSRLPVTYYGTAHEKFC